MTTSREIDSILQRGADGGRISAEEALLIYTEAPFHALGEAADAVRRRRYPDNVVTYLIDRNINYTNVCVTACRFCAFYRAPKHAEGWAHPIEEILRRCGEAVELGATQVMLQGGHHPDFGVEYYEQLFGAVKAAYPRLVIHSIGPSEILHMAKVSDVSLDEAITRIKAAGLDSIAGAGAEMLPDRPRRAIAPLKESGARWLEVMELAHRHGIESTATMMMGTGETNAERIEHLRMIRDVQDSTGGFRAFIPWTYQPENNHLKGRTQATTLEYLRMIAVSRLFFDQVAHLQASWLTTGKDVGQLALHMGVDDLGSIMLEENVISSAGARHRSNLHELIWMIRSAGRIPAQRDTEYHHLAVHRDPADDPTDERVVSHFSSIALPNGGARRDLPLVDAH
ncbi:MULTISPECIES: cyclic dehypoxanthinyl futalosine synthase [unclassified Solwaraspora]|uniref:cyclic dehypoxanthinyl futalosine synthase n=1 Tax=unclassified Solwaraspora TaxID=2627926 RepID=UPI00248BB512|nr:MULTISPECIES: cyclic dehypoxanthinyl futalosine synthase [unclassified Solwaraspora]WBB96591.1 dehypoxanthine futalosine cyclase [Solwaraspora sp. WMMA2059]WBC19504.1 dehypoxanthine futalosine cyclase [Solwaraspora sp. WMMA2080]WJK32912.1 cyclic dehypoxanthinyl futalosine synthase [Solwaraspora sp. WMMA2065]